MEKAIEIIKNLNPTTNWGLYLVFVVGLLLVGKLISLFIRKRAKKQIKLEKLVLGTVLNTVSKSLLLIIATILLLFASRIIEFNEEQQVVINTAFKVLITITIGYIIYQLVEIPLVLFSNLLEKKENKLSQMFIPVLRKSLRVIIILLVIFQIIQILSDKPLTSIIAGLGIGGLAVALAAQDTLKHFIGSFVIAGDRPFEIGERIVVDGHDGPIESIGLRSTKIRTLEGHLVSIPNGELANRTIQNIGKRPYIRRLFSIGVTYNTPQDKIEEAIKILENLLEKHEGMHEDFPPRVYFNEFASSSLNIMVIYWYHPAAYWDFMSFSQKLNLEIVRQFNEAGIEFAFPTQTVYVKKDDDETSMIK